MFAAFQPICYMILARILAEENSKNLTPILQVTVQYCNLLNLQEPSPTLLQPSEASRIRELWAAKNRMAQK